MKKKNATAFPLHSAILVGSIAAGLMVAGCSPQRMQNRQDDRMQLSPIPSAAPSSVPESQTDPKNADYETDLKEMDANMAGVNPSGLDASDLQ